MVRKNKRKSVKGSVCRATVKKIAAKTAKRK